MSTEPAFGPQIRALRRAKDLTLRDISEASGLSVSHLSRLENGLATPTADTVVRIQKVIGGDLSELLKLAHCVPQELFSVWKFRPEDIRADAAAHLFVPIRSMADGPPLRVVNGSSEEVRASRADAELHQVIQSHFLLACDAADVMVRALHNLAALEDDERGHFLAVLQMAVRGRTEGA